MVPNPFIYEINTWIWLNELSAKYGAPVRLGSVPAAEWNELASWGFDAIWLMGVWERSPRGAEIAEESIPICRRNIAAALPNYTTEDVVRIALLHSPLAWVDAHLGGPAGLAAARTRLARGRLALILDFVPEPRCTRSSLDRGTSGVFHPQSGRKHRERA